MIIRSGGAINGMGGGSGNRKGGGGAIALDIIGKTKVTIKIHVTNNDFFISYPPFKTDSPIKILVRKTDFCIKKHPLFAERFRLLLKYIIKKEF
jgi:hypothetical protein